VIVLLSINYIANPGLNDTTLAFFSWIFIMTIVIFSSIVILLNSKLNKTLQNRTMQLEETTKELVKSERFSAIGELASRISHDIRNPLSNINMSIELIKNSPPNSKISDDTINEKLKLVSKNVERISHQVNDVLEFVQDREMKKEEFKIYSCLQDTIESMHIPKNIIIKSDISEKKVLADYFQLQIVFNNLIINAIQAIGVQKGEIIFRVSEEDRKVVIQIENSGPSIPKEILPHIFETLVTTKQIGTGLGLVSCKTIIENHKGSIVAKNNPTTFVITLPK
jgi:signal transduction histidine kinase